MPEVKALKKKQMSENLMSGIAAGSWQAMRIRQIAHMEQEVFRLAEMYSTLNDLERTTERGRRMEQELKLKTHNMIKARL